MKKVGHPSLPGFPDRQGLYNPTKEHDSCGIGFVANIKNRKSHEVVLQGLTVLDNLTHRGAAGADPLAGDGAGILIQIPDRFLREEVSAIGFELPEIGEYSVGMVFLPQDEKARKACEGVVEKMVEEENLTVLGWRDLPTDNTWLSDGVREMEPFIRQVFVGIGDSGLDQDAFEVKLLVIRKRAHSGKSGR